MIEGLRRAVASPLVGRDLARLAAGATPATPLSLTLDLGTGGDDWLSCLPAAGEYWYWARPGEADWRLALGSAQHFDSAGPARFAALHNASRGLLREARYDRPPQLFFGFAFDPEASGPLPNARLVLPALLLRRRGELASLTLSVTAGRADRAQEHWLSLLDSPAAAAANRFQRQADPLADRAWVARVNAALREIAGGRFDKVVLARSARLLGEGPIDAGALLAALQASQPGCTLYAHGGPAGVFLGASPECLARFACGRIEADALAGTAWLAAAGQTAASPLDDAKNRREQGYVEAAVRRALTTLCTEVAAGDAPEILHLRQLSHLRTRLGGRLRPGVSLFDAAAALHPTPAVGGSPGPAALAWLRAHGEQRGAWYSGGFGWLDAAGDGEIAVALRCALIEGCRATLWAGAGIVAGSHAEQELAETEAKLQAMLEAFRHPAPTARPAPERTGTH